MLDRENLVIALQATTSSTNQKEASDYLEENSKMVGFAPLLLTIVMDSSVDCSARQAGVIYLKNTINRYWVTDVDDKKLVALAEQDKHLIREAIIDAIVVSPEAIRVQLCATVGMIMRHDFPVKWPHIPQKVSTLLHSMDGPSWLGALLVLRRLVKLYEYRRLKEKKPLVETMSVLMPMLLERFIALMPDNSQESCLLQKLILKIFYGLVQFSLNLDMFDSNTLNQWFELLRQVVERPVPQEVNSIDQDDRERTVWWKCKKWASATVERIFERYGSPGQVQSTYAEFSENYMAHFAVPMVNTCLGVLDGYRNGGYVAPRVLHSVLQYICTAISQSRTWKLIKSHCQELVRSVIFTLLKYSDSDEELWNDSPEEFIRIKYDIYSELHNPSVAAVSVLTGIVKRKDMLQPILEFVFEVLNAEQSDARSQDGALHMLGELSTNLGKNKKYKGMIEEILQRLVLPKVNDPTRFLRSRACSTIKLFASSKFSASFVKSLFELMVGRLCDPNEELPVKVEAAIAIQHLLEGQEKYQMMLKPHVQTVVLEVLRLVSQAEIEEMACVMEAIFEEFVDDVIPIATDVTTELANIFLHLTTQPDNDQDRTVTVMGILTTMSSILEMVEDNSEVMKHVEVQVRRVIVNVLEHQLIDYHEEMLSMVNSLICNSISEEMWQIFHELHKLVVSDPEMLYLDVMLVLHSYITVDTDSFLAHPERLNAAVEMIVTIFKDESGESDQLRASKLLECLILYCQGRIDNLIPDIVQLVLNRLHQSISETKTLKVMLLMVLVAALYYSLQLFESIIPHLQPHGKNTFNYLVNELVSIAPELKSIHDRKMTVIGLCTLIRLPPHQRPTLINEKAAEINDLLITQLIALQKAIKTVAENRLAEEKELEGKDTSDEELVRDQDLADSEDEIDEDTLEYLETIAKHQNRRSRTSGDDSLDSVTGSTDSDDWDDDSLSVYSTPFDDEFAADVFIFYKETLDALQTVDCGLLQVMTTFLTPEKTDAFTKVMKICKQRMSLAKSKQVEQQGGYAFNPNAPVPSSFDFGGELTKNNF